MLLQSFAHHFGGEAHLEVPEAVDFGLFVVELLFVLLAQLALAVVGGQTARFEVGFQLDNRLLFELQSFLGRTLFLHKSKALFAVLGCQRSLQVGDVAVFFGHGVEQLLILAAFEFGKLGFLVRLASVDYAFEADKFGVKAAQLKVFSRDNVLTVFFGL